MKRVLIRTAGITGKRVFGYLENSCEIIGYVDNKLEKHDEKCFSIYEALKICEDQDVNIVIPDKFYRFKEELQNIGICEKQIQIFWEEGLKKGEKYLFGLNEFTFLPYLEMYVTDNCNFSCKNCASFSPLVKGQTKYNFEVFKEDVQRCKSLFQYIKKYRFLGGEPLLLGDDLIQYIELVRRIYPDTDIRIATNGSLIQNVSDNLLNAIRENHVVLDISVYPHMYQKIDAVVEYCRKKEISIELFNRNSFTPVLNSKKEKFPFSNVRACECVTIKDGYIAKCPLVFHVQYYNSTFNENIPDIEGRLDLYKETSGFEIGIKLEKTFELCDYCNLYKIWHHKDNEEECRQLIREKSVKEDWQKM